MDDLEEALAECVARGEAVAVATLVSGGSGARAGARMLIGSAGQTLGDLGWPRLNQRVALWAEQLLERGSRGSPEKTFDAPGAPAVVVRVELHGRAAPGAGSC